MAAPSWLPVLWFLVVIALIPLALWLLKRSPLQQLQQGGARVVGATHLGPGQRLLTVEVGEGDEKRWLLLGVTGQQISRLHEMAPGSLPVAPAAIGFADLLKRVKP
jgi:flagellar protein FliO/FliZ